jgi:hypothetical protein
MIIEAGKVAEFTIFVISSVAALFYLGRAIMGKSQALLPMPQIDAISDGVDKAAEEGKPVYCSPGCYANLTGNYAVMTISGMNVFRHTARLCVQKGVRMYGISSVYAEVLPLMDGIFREVCVAEGKPEAYRREDIIYLGRTERAYEQGLAGLFDRTGISMLVSVGACSGGSPPNLSAARRLGAIVVAGTPRYFCEGCFAVCADYPLFMDDVYSIGGYLSDDEVVKSSLVGSDAVKFLLLGILIIGVILAVAGLPLVTTDGWLFQ